MTRFAAGTVGHTLERMRGVWHDRVEIYDLSGVPLGFDELSGSPGPAPFDNLVYVDFDGCEYRQTNVTFRGRPVATRTFTGTLVDGVLVFHRLGPEAPEHIGVSGGPGVLFFSTRSITDHCRRYSEPDCVRLLDDHRRTRTTLLYRNGTAVRTLTAEGVRLTPTCDERVSVDPRGEGGPVHQVPGATRVWVGE